MRIASCLIAFSGGLASMYWFAQFLILLKVTPALSAICLIVSILCFCVLIQMAWFLMMGRE